MSTARLRRVKRADPTCGMAVAVERLEPRLACAAVSVPAAQAGSLTQYLLARVPGAPAALAPYACAPTSATNALVYLQRQYPALYGTELAGRSLADWAGTSVTLAGPGFMDTQPARGGTVPEANLPGGLRAFLESRGFGNAVEVSGMVPQGEPGGYIETNVGSLPAGYLPGVPTSQFILDALADGHPVIVTIVYPPAPGTQVSGHNVLVTGMTRDAATATGSFAFVDPLDAARAVRRGPEGLLPVGALKPTSGAVTVTPELPLPVVNGVQDVVRDVLTLRYDQYKGQIPYQRAVYGETIAFIVGATVLRPTASALASRVAVRLEVGVRRGVPVVMTHAQIARASMGTAAAGPFVVTTTVSGRLQRLAGDRWVDIPRGSLAVGERDFARLAVRREIRPGDTVRWIPAAAARARGVSAFRFVSWNGTAASATRSLVNVLPGLPSAAVAGAAEQS